MSETTYLAEGTLARVLRRQDDNGRVFNAGDLVTVEYVVTDAEMEDGEPGYYGLSDPNGSWSGWYVDLDNLEDATGAIREWRIYAEILVDLELSVIATSLEEAIKAVRDDPQRWLEEYSSRGVSMKVAEVAMP
jgi:hypothetical protein